MIHFSSYKFQIILFALIGISVLQEVNAQEIEIIKNRSVRDREVQIKVYPDSLVYSLPHRNIRENSEIVISENDTLRLNIDYTIDYANGVLHLTGSGIEYDSLLLSYRTNQPFEPIVAQYWTGFISREDDSASLVKIIPHTDNTARSAAPIRDERLKSHGSLVRGVKVGTNEGLSLNSGLRIQMEGEISDGINLIASMTDQNSPIQPEGNTQTLKEIDKVYVGLTGEKFELTLGDIGVNYGGSNFANYRRKLQGGSGSADIGGTTVTVTGAVSRGKFRTLSFNGIEGNQGPYRLIGDEGNLEVFVIAGSENVYIDGEKMSRGETKDYVIDYSNAELTFTPYRIISSDSRIAVDYEFSDRSYNRSVLASSLTTEIIAGKVRFGGRFIRESDDRDNPIGTTFTESELSALASTDEENVFVEGGIKVGEEKGAYNKIFDPLKGDSVFKYVGLNPDGTFNGVWSVFFTQVGAGNGDYDNKLGDSLLVSPQGNFYFEYVGIGNGSYIAKKRIRSPSAQSIVSFNLAVKPSEKISIQTEIGLSSKDKNTFSSLNDNDNTGSALLIKGVFNTTAPDKGGVVFDSYIRRIAEEFSSLDRIDEIEFDRRWNKPVGLEGTETIIEGGAKIKSRGSDELYGRFGRLEVENEWRSNRIEIGGEKNIRFLGNISLNQEILNSKTNDGLIKSEWKRRKGRLKKNWNKFTPVFGFEFEDKEDSDSLNSGFKYLEYFAGIEIKNIGPLNLLTEYTVRNDEERLNDLLVPRSKAISKTLGFEIPSTKIYSANLRFSRRTREFKGMFKDNLSNSQSNLIDMRSDLHPMNGALRLVMDYRAASELLAGIERVYLKVEEGRGNFRFDEDVNEYVPDISGDFILRTRQTDNYEPVTDLRVSMRLMIEPKRLNANRRNRRAKSGFWQGVSSRTFIRIDEKSKDSDTGALLRLEPSKFRNPNSTLFWNLTFEEDLTMFKRRNGSYLRLRYRYLDNFNNQFITGGEESLTKEASFRWRQTRSTKTRYDIEGSRSSTLRSFSSSLRRGRDIISNEVSIDLSRLPSSRVEFGAKFTVGRDMDRLSSNDLKASLTEIELRNNYFLKGRGMIRFLTSWAHVGVTPNGAPLTFEMANGLKEGDSYKWSLSFDYKMGSNLNAMLTYEGRNEAFRETRHVGKAEVRAWF